jgi:hypothetical protein
MYAIVLTTSSWLPIAIALFASVTAPIMLNALNTRNASRERDRLWEREDEKAREAAAQRAADIARQNQVAKRAEEAAELLAEATARAAAKAEDARIALIASNETVARIARESAASTNAELRVIHRLVNSSLLAAMQAELDSTLRLRAVLKELIAANKNAGIEPTPESAALMATTDARIIELGSEVEERRRATSDAAAEIAASEASRVAFGTALPEPESAT